MEERWVPAFGHEDTYQVSDLGRVRHNRPNSPYLKLGDRRGYKKCSMGRPQKDVSVHRLVWQSFNGPIPQDYEINHLNGVKSDNRLCNLEAVTRSENCKHRVRVLGKMPHHIGPRVGETNGRAKLTWDHVREIRTLRGRVSHKQLAARYGVSPASISFIMTGVTWKEEP